jgi:hypothetical protein
MKPCAHLATWMIRGTRNLTAKPISVPVAQPTSSVNFSKPKTFSKVSRDSYLEIKRQQLEFKKPNFVFGNKATGIYNFKKMRDNLLIARSQVDVEAANFTTEVETKDSPGRGRGLFAACSTEAGAIFLCGKAFCADWGHEAEASIALTYDDLDDRIKVIPAGSYKAVV